MLCLQKVFKEMDEDGSGHFSSFEFKIVLRKLGKSNCTMLYVLSFMYLLSCTTILCCVSDNFALDLHVSSFLVLKSDLNMIWLFFPPCGVNSYKLIQFLKNISVRNK